MAGTQTKPTRRSILSGAAGSAVLLAAPPILGKAKSPYAGTTIRGAAFSLPFHQYLRQYFPEFEEKTGIKVAFDIEAFPVYNQRMDLELSTGGSSYDVIIVTFIYQGRWIGAGWVTDLDRFTKNPEDTPPDWDPADFIPGVEASMRDAKGHTYAYGVEAGAMLLYAARGDLIEKAGLALPTTMDELIRVCEAVNGKEGVAAWTADSLHHWNWPPYLMGMGGGIFKDPPKDLTPMPDTRLARQGPKWNANLPMPTGRPGIFPIPTTRPCIRNCQAAPTCAQTPSPGACRLPRTRRARSSTPSATAWSRPGRRATFPASPAMVSASPRARARRARRGNSSNGRSRRRC